MNWRMLDLNLLVVFDAVAQARSATRAGARLNMTQPAISHALARLRGALQDELFVRTPEGMESTPYAERLAGPVRACLEGLAAALDGAATFDPATTAPLWFSPRRSRPPSQPRRRVSASTCARAAR